MTVTFKIANEVVNLPSLEISKTFTTYLTESYANEYSTKLFTKSIWQFEVWMQYRILFYENIDLKFESTCCHNSGFIRWFDPRSWWSTIGLFGQFKAMSLSSRCGLWFVIKTFACLNFQFSVGWIRSQISPVLSSFKVSFIRQQVFSLVIQFMFQCV